MSPFDFYFSDPSLNLDRLTFKAPILFSEEDLVRLGLKNSPMGQDFLFQEIPDFFMGACYRREADSILIASAFGAYKFQGAEKLNQNEDALEFSFKSCSSLGAIRYGSAIVTRDWSDGGGDSIEKLWMRATRNDDDSWTPPFSKGHFRSSGGINGSKSLQCCTILLPSPATKIKALGEGVEIKTDQHRFVIADPLAAEIILSGNVQWGYPQENGCFQLTKRLF